MTDPTPIRPAMPSSRDLPSPAGFPPFKERVRRALQAFIEDRESVRLGAALLLLLCIILGLFAFRGAAHGPGSAFNIAAIVVILYSLVKGVFQGVDAFTFLAPIIAIGAALLAFVALVHPIVATVLTGEDLSLFLSLASIIVLLVSCMITEGLFGLRETDRVISSGMESRAAFREHAPEHEIDHLEGLEPGWGPDAAQFPHRYYINYTFSHSYGHSPRVVAVARSAPITCDYDLRTMAEDLRLLVKQELPHLRGHRVVITSWQRFESPEVGPGTRDGLPKPELPKNVIAFRR